MDGTNNLTGSLADQYGSFDQTVTTSMLREENIAVAMDHVKQLQDATINSTMKAHTVYEGDDMKRTKLDEKAIRALGEFDVASIMDKRAAELGPAERVVATLFFINNQVANIDKLVQKVVNESEKDFLNAYSGHMGMIMRELRDFRKKINSQKFELKKNKQIKNLQAEVDYFTQEALHYRSLDQEQQLHITEVHQQNEGLRDDAYVLRQALLNSKVK